MDARVKPAHDASWKMLQAASSNPQPMRRDQLS
jgi:hypothetical protein